jgi:hypothetical protein
MGVRASKKTVEQKQQSQLKNDQLITSKKHKLLSLKSNINNALVSTSTNVSSYSGFSYLVNISLSQLDREGKNLIKADLIATIIALDPQKASNLFDLQNMTIQDLNVLIRSIIYDPEFIMKRYEQTTKTTQPVQTVSTTPTLTSSTIITQDCDLIDYKL